MLKNPSKNSEIQIQIQKRMPSKI